MPGQNITLPIREIESRVFAQQRQHLPRPIPQAAAFKGRFIV
jgi:hypothetical protein